MNIYILTDNFAGGHFLAEHGLSYLIEQGATQILFDTGAGDVFLKNAEKLKISLSAVKTVVLSHGHWDHGGGLKYLKNKKLITHPNSFIKRFRKSNNKYIGLNQSKKEISEKFDLLTTKNPYWITENIVFLGEIPRKNNFEIWETPYIDDLGEKDFIVDDSAIVIVDDKELVIVVGCSHSGVCNIIDYAKKVTGIDKIKAVIGGFHLKKADNQTKQTIEYLKNQSIKQIFPSHCTQLPALTEFYKEFKIQQVKTGMKLSF